MFNRKTLEKFVGNQMEKQMQEQQKLAQKQQQQMFQEGGGASYISQEDNTPKLTAMLKIASSLYDADNNTWTMSPMEVVYNLADNNATPEEIWGLFRHFGQDNAMVPAMIQSALGEGTMPQTYTDYSSIVSSDGMKYGGMRKAQEGEQMIMGRPASAYNQESLQRFLAEGERNADLESKIAEISSLYEQGQISLEEARAALAQEEERVARVRGNVIPASRELDRLDNLVQTQFKQDRSKSFGSESRDFQAWENYIGAKFPAQLREAQKNLPQSIKDVLPNEGRYNVAQWDSKANAWNPELDPHRELYCTPYGCFAYQKAGASDVPIVGGNYGFVGKAKEDLEFPFEKIPMSERQPGDMQILWGWQPGSYSDPDSKDRFRPHHTTIFTEEKDGKVFGYNADNGNRLRFGIDGWKTMPREQLSRKFQRGVESPEYYRYVGQTKKMKHDIANQEAELQKMKTESEDLESQRGYNVLPTLKAQFLPTEEKTVDVVSFEEQVQQKMKAIQNDASLNARQKKKKMYDLQNSINMANQMSGVDYSSREMMEAPDYDPTWSPFGSKLKRFISRR